MEIKLSEILTLDIDDELDCRCESDIEETEEDGWIKREIKNRRIIIRRQQK